MEQQARVARDLREDCIAQALAIIDKAGIEALSIRDVARRLGVSHGAPYKHFPSRDHILAEIVARAFQSFADHLDARRRSDDPFADLANMGVAYLDYAERHPLQYRLMFGVPLPDADRHPGMMACGQHAFALLTDAVGRIHAFQGREPDPTEIELDSMFVWSTMHGLATIRQTHAGKGPKMAAAEERTAAHIRQKILAALGGA